MSWRLHNVSITVHFLRQGVLALGLAIRCDLISRPLTGTKIPGVRGSDSDALGDRMLKLIMMLATAMNHLLNMLTLAPWEETEPGLRNVNEEKQEVYSAWNCVCLRP